MITAILLSITAFFSVIAAAISFISLSAVGHFHQTLNNIASSQSLLTIDAAKTVLDTIRWEFEEAENSREWRYQFFNLCLTELCRKHDIPLGYFTEPLDPEAEGGLFETVDNLTGFSGSEFDSAEYQQRRAAVLPVAHF